MVRWPHMRATLRATKRPIRRTTILTCAMVACLVGLAVGRHVAPVSAAMLIAGAILLLVAYPKRGVAAILAAVVAGGLLGSWRGSSFAQTADQYQQLYGHKVVLRALAAEDGTYGKNSQLVFEARNIELIAPYQQQLPGRLKISGFGENMVYRGDVLEVQGTLRPTLGGKRGQMSFANFTRVATVPDVAAKLRQQFAAGMQNAVPDPEASFGLGILIGQRSTLPPDVSTNLSTVGLTHVIAVSGYNLTIIVVAVRRLMAKRSKYQGTLLSLALIAGFLLITGFSASIVRAAIVSGLTLWAAYYGRSVRPLLLISLVAAGTALVNPLYLWSDLGWYLSFLAFFGVLVIAPVITRRLYKDKEPKLVAGVLIETVCAQLATLPFILFVFQQLSLVSVVSNLLIVPLVPLAMLFSLVAGLAGMFVPFVAGWLAWPATYLLTYMLEVAGLLARVPGALVHYSISVAGLVLLYGVLCFAIYVMWRTLPKKRGIITEINAKQSKGEIELVRSLKMVNN